MIVVTTSWAPEVALRKPGMKPAKPPREAPTSRASGIVIHGPASLPIQVTTAIAPTVPTRNWPRPPMLNSPARKPMATPRPARTRGVAYTSVDVMPFGLAKPLMRDP